MNRLLWAVIGFVLGIIAASLYGLSWVGAVYVSFLSLLFLLLYLPKRVRLFLLITSLLFGAVLGIGRTALQPSSIPKEFAPLIGTEAEVEGVVVADPDIREVTQRLTVEVRKGNIKTNILVVAPTYPHVRYGEHIRAFGSIEAPEPFETDTGRTFRYDLFLAKDGVYAVMQRSVIEVIGPREGMIMQIRGALSDFKFGGIDALAVALPEPQASLAAGLVLGGKQGLGTELLNDFIAVGLVHIVVLSGYNVMIIAEFIMCIFGFLSRRWAAGAAAVTIAAFVLAAGAGAASVRAGIMAGIALYGRATGKTYDAFRALIAAGIVMILWNPLTLAYDPGFQLSFVATIGLIFGAPLIERKLTWIKSAFMREIVSSTLAAQIAVLPLLLYQNGLFSVIALPANLLVLPIVPLAMLLSAIAGVAGFLVPMLAPAIGFPAYLLLSYVTTITTNAASLPLAAFSLPAFPFWVVIVAYATLTLLALRSASPRRPS